MNNHAKRIFATAAVVIAMTFSVCSLVFETDSVDGVIKSHGLR